MNEIVVLLSKKTWRVHQLEARSLGESRGHRSNSESKRNGFVGLLVWAIHEVLQCTGQSTHFPNNNLVLMGLLAWPCFGLTSEALPDSWLISGLVDRSCRLDGGVDSLQVSSHSTGCFYPGVQLLEGQRHLWLVHLRLHRLGARSSEASWLFFFFLRREHN